MRRWTAIFLVTAMGTAGAAAEEIRPLFAELSRGVDPTDERAVAEALRLLREQSPDFWEHRLCAGPLRARLARDLSETVALALFRRAGRSREVRGARIAAVAENLSSRPDLGALLLGSDTLRALADEDPELAVRLAIRTLRTGDAQLAASLLARPEHSLLAANGFCDDAGREGLVLLADALSGRIAVSAEARARLALCEPDIWNARRVHALGEDRTAGLVEVARQDPDHAVRVLAARLLHRAGGDLEATARAYRDARSWHIEPREWRRMGHWFESAPRETDIPPHARVALFGGLLEYSSPDPDQAEEMVGAARGMLAAEKDARIRASMLTALLWNDHVLVVLRNGEWKLVPAARALVADLRAGARPGEDRFALAITELEGVKPDLPRNHPPPSPSQVLRELPKAADPADQFVAAEERVEHWLRTDPDHLLDALVLKRLLSWSEARRRSLLDRYPRPAIRRLLLSPPSRYSITGRGYWADDATGATNRGRMLVLLEDMPRHWDLVLEGQRILDWPAINRRQAGRLCHRIAADAGMGVVERFLIDEPVLLGFLERTIRLPYGAEDARFAASRLANGSVSLLDGLASWADYSLPENLGPIPREPWPRRRVPLGKDARANLASTLTHCPDPWIAWIAARLLAMRGEDDDYATLLGEPGARLRLTGARSSHPLADLIWRLDTPAKLETALAFVGNPRIPARARADVFEELAYHQWPRNFGEEERAAMLDRVRRWIEARAPKLDSGLAEMVLPAWLDFAQRCALEFRLPATYREEVNAAYERAVRAIPRFGPRWRLENPGPDD